MLEDVVGIEDSIVSKFVVEDGGLLISIVLFSLLLILLFMLVVGVVNANFLFFVVESYGVFDV